LKIKFHSGKHFLCCFTCNMDEKEKRKHFHVWLRHELRNKNVFYWIFRYSFFPINSESFKGFFVRKSLVRIRLNITYHHRLKLFFHFLFNNLRFQITVEKKPQLKRISEQEHTGLSQSPPSYVMSSADSQNFVNRYYVTLWVRYRVY
jgi:hypothetical protein